MVNDFRKVRRPLKQAGAECTRALWQRAWQARLGSNNRESKKEVGAATRFQKITRGTAYQYCRALDHQLALANIPMSTFVADFAEGPPASRSLRPGQKRYFVEVSSGPACPGLDVGAKRRRAVLQAADGSRRWELPQFGLSGRPHITFCGDMGGSGLPSWLFLLGAVRLRGAMLFDPFHRMARDWKLALQDAQAWPYILEGQTLLTWLHGPWQSESWFIVLQESMEEYLRSAASSEAPHVASTLSCLATAYCVCPPA